MGSYEGLGLLKSRFPVYILIGLLSFQFFFQVADLFLCHNSSSAGFGFDSCTQLVNECEQEHQHSTDLPTEHESEHCHHGACNSTLFLVGENLFSQELFNQSSFLGFHPALATRYIRPPSRPPAV
jgi:hypothetical protein